MRRMVLFLAIGLLLAGRTKAAESRPNILIILTDDQGYGDLGIHGNPVVKTPNIDRLARESVQFTEFHVSPVCAPTRASLMTGRYNYRTRVVDTYIGRAMMDPEEVTLAEMLKRGGYHTGIFGKWHLGDNYPMRPIDRGFDEELVLKGGGLVQPADPPQGNSYFDPFLEENGKQVRKAGYCSDIFTDAALQFIQQHSRKNGRRSREPFFCYLPFNAPHTPLQVPESEVAPYRKSDLTPSAFPSKGYPIGPGGKPDDTARVYGMVSNIDKNVGRLLGALKEWDLDGNTIVIFFTDNGPQQPRYNAGLRDLKGSVFEGGIHVPFFFRWVDRVKPALVDRLAAHIDIAPTLLEICRIKPPGQVKFDGRSLWPLIRGYAAPWEDRTLFFQWHRGDEPELFRAFAARNQRYKLVQPLGVSAPMPENWKFLLFDLQEDPYETTDIAEKNPETVRTLRQEYQAWFDDVSSTRGYEPPRIGIGGPENPLLLTRQDERGPKAGWGPKGIGFWETRAVQAGKYEMTVLFDAAPVETTCFLKLGEQRFSEKVHPGMTQVRFKSVFLKKGPVRIEPWLGEPPIAGATYVEVRKN